MAKYMLILGSMLLLTLGACDDNGDEGAGDDSSGNGGESTDNTADNAGGVSVDTITGTVDITVTGLEEQEADSGNYCGVLAHLANNTGTAFDNVAFNLNFHDGDRLVGGGGCGQAGLGGDSTRDMVCNSTLTCEAMAGLTFSLAAGTAQCNTEGEETGYEPCDQLIAVTTDFAE